mmetsp:Transcript_28830/g.81226  ORF Transcript_28830/g.81226 Transcript_28830/m.81226 type:complete len:335 (-) Transcript_28830:192-1196(-)
MPQPLSPRGSFVCCWSCRMPSKTVTHTAKLCLVLLLVVVVVMFVQYMDRQHIVIALEWLKEHPFKGAIVFVALYSVGVVILLPGSLLSLGAGAVYGLGLGALLTWVATIIGQTMAFLLGRYLLRDIVVDLTYSKYPKWGTIDAALAREGWKLVSLLRLSPIMPYNVLNYILSITGIGFIPFTVASAITCFPWVITFVYFGSLVHTLADIVDGKAGPDRQTTMALAVLSVLLFVVAGFYTTVISRKAIRQALLEAPGNTAVDVDSLGLLPNGSRDIEVLLDDDPASNAYTSSRADTRESSSLLRTNSGSLHSSSCPRLDCDQNWPRGSERIAGDL